ncbi:MAG: MBL fold metallo-hydrolase [Bdellovibrionales bacterium]|nr:MBL fold metallo-hydrolase [Bdellovibrionales bacterium]
MKIHTINTNNSSRNIYYFLEIERNTFYVIDPFSFECAEKFLQSKNGNLVGIINTHAHFDHIGGNAQLFEKYKCDIFVYQDALDVIPCATQGIKEGHIFSFGDDELKVIFTPGHTKFDICLLHSHKGKEVGLFVGDTLFSAGVGNCINGGDPEVLFESITKLQAMLDDDIKLYYFHEYLKNNIGFTLSLTPNNKTAQNILSSISSNNFDSTLGVDKKINTFLNLDSLVIREALNMKLASNKEVFLGLRKLRNKW